MNYRYFYYNIFCPRIITEDYESTVKQIKNIIQNNDLEPESIDNILDIYNTVPVDEGRESAKKDSDLIALTYMYIVKNIDLSIDDIKSEYASYLNSKTSVNKKLLLEYIVELQNEIRGNGLTKPDKKAEKLQLIKSKTKKLIDTIHRYKKKEEFTGEIINEENDKVYEDENLVIFLADSKQKCIYYGRNTNLCISTKSANYYWKYRMGKMSDDDLGMTTYFVIPKNRIENELIVIDAMGNENGSSDTFGYTIIESSGKQIEDLYNISEQQIISKFPELIKPFRKNVFKFLPYAEKEKRFEWIENNVSSVEDLDNYEDYEMYLQTDNKISVDDWQYIYKNVNDKEMRNLLLLAAELSKPLSIELQDKYFTEKEKKRYLGKIAESSRYSYFYARDVSKGQDVPDIILQGIAKDSQYSYSYAKDVLEGQNVPEDILQSIEKDSYYSYYYARDVLKGQNVPDIILQGIAKNSEHSFSYARDVLEGQNVPDIILQGIAKDSKFSYYYARDVLEGQNVPDIILQSIAEDSNYSYDYARYVLEKGQNVPENILQSIAKNSESSYLYAKNVLKGQNVPDIILQSIAKNSKYSTMSLTEAKLHSLSKEIVRSNAENMQEIEIRNFSPEYSADKNSLIYDSTLDGFMGQGIFDNSDKLVGYAYGYKMGADGEYDEFDYIDMNEITFFNQEFKQAVQEKGIDNICTESNTFYISNLVVDKQHRFYVKPLLNALLNNINNQGYKFIAFDALSDTQRLFDSARKASRLKTTNLVKLAEVDAGDSKLLLFYIK